mmetsp:Transcript_18265/g.44840  ORF Transcript_18265/g.44840 Transcript_18265/m.44840 type:complete len:119 (+) Transcript_18265:1157-1513(+)
MHAHRPRDAVGMNSKKNVHDTPKPPRPKPTSIRMTESMAKLTLAALSIAKMNTNAQSHIKVFKRPYLSAMIPQKYVPKSIPIKTTVVRELDSAVVKFHSHWTAGPRKESIINSIASAA